jgi:putative hemolysin
MKWILTLTAILIVLISCTALQTQGEPAPVSTDTPQANMPNPASAFCVEQGFKSEIRAAADGSQSGVCIFPDGSECDEWAYFRGECKPGDTLANSISTASPVATEPSPTVTAEIASDGWKIYRNEKFGYSFHYPADTNIVIDDEPLNSVSIIGPLIGGDNWPLMGFSHPSNREEYRPPEGVDLEKWLIDHYMWTPNYPNISDFREADVQIAGVSAIHIRHRRSGQSYASDKYLFARGGQLYQIGFLHIGDKEDWDIYNHFLESIQFEQ